MKKRYILFLILIFAAAFFLSVSAKSSRGTSFEEWEIEEIYINRGDTLWTIARGNCAENEDIRDWISAVRELNSMDGGMLYEGQTLKIYKGAALPRANGSKAEQ